MFRFQTRRTSIYDGGDFWHFVTYGLTELYEKEDGAKGISGFGYEMTFKLKKMDFQDEEGELKCICGILQAIARITFNNGEIFRPYEYLYTVIYLGGNGADIRYGGTMYLAGLLLL